MGKPEDPSEAYVREAKAPAMVSGEKSFDMIISSILVVVLKSYFFNSTVVGGPGLAI
jgi:hypothetical protein